MGRLARIATSERGATTVEYAAIASLISIVAIGSIEYIGVSVVTLWSSIPAF